MTASANPDDEDFTIPHTGERIRALRIARGWNKSELARRVETSDTNIRNWEKNRTQKMTAYFFMRLCQELGCRPEYLMFGELPILSTPATALRFLPILNTSSEPVVLNRLRDLERSEVSASFLNILGCTDHGQAGWFIVEHDGHIGDWRSGDALLIDQRRKGWTLGQWYLISLIDRPMEVGRVSESPAGVLELVLSDPGGSESRASIDRSILYLGHVLGGYRVTTPTNPAYDFMPIVNPSRFNF